LGFRKIKMAVRSIDFDLHFDDEELRDVIICGRIMEFEEDGYTGNLVENGSWIPMEYNLGTRFFTLFGNFDPEEEMDRTNARLEELEPRLEEAEQIIEGWKGGMGRVVRFVAASGFWVWGYFSALNGWFG